MKEVVLSFPNPVLLAEFILINRIYKVRTDLTLFTLSGILLDEQIEIACTKYEAIIVQSSPVPIVPIINYN